MTSEGDKYAAELFREFILFYSVLFFTCVVGLIGLLPEFEKTKGFVSWSCLVISIVYFGLLFGIDYSMHKYFFIYRKNRELSGRFAFEYPEIEYLADKLFKNQKYLELFLIAGTTLVFILLYLVKIGVLQ